MIDSDLLILLFHRELLLLHLRLLFVGMGVLMLLGHVVISVLMRRELRRLMRIEPSLVIVGHFIRLLIILLLEGSHVGVRSELRVGERVELHHFVIDSTSYSSVLAVFDYFQMAFHRRWLQRELNLQLSFFDNLHVLLWDIILTSAKTHTHNKITCNPIGLAWKHPFITHSITQRMTNPTQPLQKPHRRSKWNKLKVRCIGVVFQKNGRRSMSDLERTISHVELWEILVECFSFLDWMVVRRKWNLLVNAISDTLIANHITDFFQVNITLFYFERSTICNYGMLEWSS